MSIISTNRASTQNHSHIEFGNRVKTPVKPKHLTQTEFENLLKAREYVAKALETVGDETSSAMNAGNAVVCLRRAMSSINQPN